MKRIVVRQEVVSRVFLVGALEDALFAATDRLAVATSASTPKGSKEDVLTGLILCSFLNEAWINAIGSQCISGWNPRRGAEIRYEQIFRQYFATLDVDARPLDSVTKVREIRNTFAHAKPVLRQNSDVIVRHQQDEGDPFEHLRHDVDQYLTLDTFSQLVEDSEQFRSSLLQASGLRNWDIRTRAEVSETYLSDADSS